MRRLLILSALLVVTASAQASPMSRDVHMDAYLGIWARNADITLATVARLYARRVDYYGRPMSNAAVFQDKLAFVRRWSRRSYDVVPGTVVNDCRPDTPDCRIVATFVWHRADAWGHRESGTSTVRLALARKDGAMRIVRESGAPITAGRR